MAINQDLKDKIERIKFIHRLTQRQIADKLAIQPTYLSDLINGRAPMNAQFAERIRTTFGDLSGQEDEHNSNISIREHKMFGSNNESKVKTIPLIPIDAVAGYPGPDVDSVYLSQCQQYAVPEFIDKGANFLIRVSGTSMMPTYCNGDILACRKIEKLTFFQWGTVYVMDTAQGSLVKRVYEDKDDAEQIICKSDNFETYPEFKISKHEIRSASLVIGMIRIE